MPDDADRRDYTEANRRAWNETAALHAESQLGELLRGFGDPSFSTLDAIERSVFAEIDIAGKAVAQLCCNNGRELLSVRRLGAGRCVGFDISDAFIAQGARLAAAAGLEGEVTFVRSDVYDISHGFDGVFDVVYVTIGALGWLPDLERWFRVVTRLLRPGGWLFIYEMHPILDMFDPDGGLELRHSYFRRTPYECADDPDYYDPSRRVQATSYWFHHALADVIGGCLRNGLALKRFEEYGHDLSMVFRAFQDLANKPPLSYALVARKESG